MDRMYGASRGLTLIELLIALLILGILMSLGVPAMRQFLYGIQVKSEISRLMASVQLTRSEAILRNHTVTMCPSSMASAGEPICGGTYADGWIVFSNRNRDNVVDDNDRVVQISDALLPGYTLTNRKGTIPAAEQITYRSDGSSWRNRTLLVCPPDGSPHNSRSLVMNIVGRPRLTHNWGTCPLP
jgi:type IV fimbrial biogenesis protein FimT